jgi:hypothetical protein
MVIKGVEIQLLSPTQSVIDRLCWFYFKNDRQCMDQAIAICENQDVNLDRFKRWSKDEGEGSKYAVFLTNLKERLQKKTNRSER